MKIKYITFFILSVLLFSSCVKDNTTTSEEEKKQQAELIQNFVSTAEFVVPIRAGYTTTVLYKGVPMASTSKPMTILVPKQTTTKSISSEISTYYQEGESSESKSSLWQTVVFEDSRAGDYDYNDLIFQSHYKIEDNNLRVSVQPIALGSTKPIKLGFKWVQGGNQGEVIVAEDCRKTLFDGRSGFINTYGYDIHIAGFRKEVNVPISGVSNPVNIWWFIEVDNGFRINAINTTGSDCLDDNGMPYGFAISDCGVGPQTKAISALAATNDETLWNNTIVPTSFDAWAFMPAQPTIPAEAISMDGYQAWKGNKINKLDAGKSFSDQLQFVSGFELYVSGTLTLNSFYGSGPAKIYVMPGGHLNIGSSTLSGVEIVNFGTVKFGERATFQNMTFKTGGSIEASDASFTFGAGTKFYVKNTLSAKQIASNGAAEAYFGSVKLDQMLDLTNNGKMFVAVSAEVSKVNLNSNVLLYVGCKLTAEEQIYVTNTATLSVKGYISTARFNTTASAIINLMNGGLLETSSLSISNTPTTQINIIGSGYGAVTVENIQFGGGLDLRNTFKGNMYLNYSKMTEGNNVIELTNPRLVLPAASVQLNSKNAKVATSDCCPGFNSNVEEAVSTWFRFPMEGERIYHCYDFDAWLKGNFDFTLKPGGKAFDVYDTAPKEGEQLTIYDIN